jgi:hypothetical protein
MPDLRALAPGIGLIWVTGATWLRALRLASHRPIQNQFAFFRSPPETNLEPGLT